MMLFFDTKKYIGMVNVQSGDILAYERKAQHRKLTANIKDNVNQFPYTDLDFVILRARKTLEEAR